MNKLNSFSAMIVARIGRRRGASLAGQRIIWMLLLGLLIGLVGIGLPAGQGAAQTSWQWYKTDPHVHSVVSGDAEVDLGIISKGTNQGYNGIFLTDHDPASGYQVAAGTANNIVFDDSLSYPWTTATYGTPSSTSAALVTSPVHSGTNSLHLSSTSTGYAESYAWTVRGPNQRSGDITLKVSIYPTRIDPGSGIYVSASFGGDPTVYKTPLGYTTTSGVITEGKSTVMLWQLGTTRAPSTNPNQRVLVYSLGSYTLNTWNTYTIDVSSAFKDIPAADQPLDYQGLTHLKMTVASNGGTVDAYFDTYSMTAATPQTAASEFVYRNGFVGNYNTPSFTIFPSDEMGQNKHAQRFNFGITQTSQYVGYTNGTDGIATTQQTGYPSMINHPGTTITTQEVTSTQGEGADFIETRNPSFISTWDSILQQGVQIIGSWSTDSHGGTDYVGSPATYIYATAMDFNTLMHSFFEGRVYNANNNFPGQVIFNLSNTSSTPYPARYPVYIPSTQTSATASLVVTGGVGAGYSVKWLLNGAVIVTDNILGGSSYSATKTIALSGTTNYIRAEVRSPSGAIVAMTEPIFFIQVAGLPSDKTYHVDSITTSNGLGYTKISTQGITATSWDSNYQAIALTLSDPANTLVDLLIPSAANPQQIKVDGNVVSAATSLSGYQSSTSSSWYYDPTARLLYLQVLHATTLASVFVDFSTAADTQPPTAPTNLTATAVSINQVNLTWSASTDNDTVTRYDIYRNGGLLASVGATTSYSDTTAAYGTSYQYQVDAQDASGNISALSSVATATTLSSLTFAPTADDSVDASAPTANYGTATTLSVFGGSPPVDAYLQFAVTNLPGPVQTVGLRLYSTNGTSSGPAVYGTSNNWGEGTITWNTAPGPSTGVIDQVSSIAANSWAQWNVTPLVTGNGTYSFVLACSASACSPQFSSREGTTPPQLVINLVPPSPSATMTSTPSPTASSTATATATPTSTVTPTITPTSLPSPTFTATATATAMPTPTITPMSTPTASPTSTITPTDLPTSTATITPTDSPSTTPTDAPTSTSTPTSSPTITPTETSTPTITPTATPTVSPTSSATDSPTITPTPSPTASPTDVPTNSPTDSPTSTGTVTPVPTDSPTASPSITPTDLPTSTPTITPTITPTQTDTTTASPTDTPTDIPSSTPTLTPTNSPTTTPTDSPTMTPTASPTATISPTTTPTFTATPSFTPTLSPTPTAPPTSTASRTPTITPTSTLTPASTVSAYQAAVLADNPVSYWRLGELSGTTAADSVDGNPGTINGGVTLGVPGALASDSNTAMSFNGTNGYIGIADKANLDVAGDFSLELWAKPALLGNTMVAAQKSGSTTTTWQYRIKISSNKQWQGSVFIGNATFSIFSGIAASTTRWDHLVLTRSGSTLTLYMNGVSVGTTNASGALNVGTGIFAIGERGSDLTDYFQGSIDEVAFYNTALPASRVLAHYNAAQTTPTPTATSATLAAWAPLEVWFQGLDELDPGSPS